MKGFSENFNVKLILNSSLSILTSKTRRAK